FLPHPAVVCGFFFWDFGLDFALATEAVLREGARTYDMTNSKASVHSPGARHLRESVRGLVCWTASRKQSTQRTNLL
ncbi:hypothetical protein JG688_00007598, partial [Phytophthora aleatoria]